MLTADILQIADERMNGSTLQEIASKEGCHESTISRKLSKPEVKAYLDRLQSHLIEKTLPIAADNIHHCIESYKTKDKEDSQAREHGFKASLKVMESAGLLPGNQQSIYIQQVYNDNRSEMPDIVKDLFNRVTGSKQANLLDVIEAEVA